VRVARIGMGARRATRACERLRRERIGAVVVAGVCGAVDPALVPGAVVVADALVGPDGERVAIDAAPLVAALARHGIASKTGAIAGVERLFGGPPRAVHVARGACAVDMESWWLAPLAQDRPFAVLRVVSDGPGNELLRPAMVANGVRALASLRAAGGALADWAQAVHPGA
jgi:4-hydroxy-3-methylbut-2-enyl diphosphate reductase